MDTPRVQKIKMYFACSVRGGRDDGHLYEQLVRFLRKKGEILTEFNIDKDLTSFGTPGATTDTYKRDMKMLEQSEVMVAEITTPSLGVGYEIAKAEELDIPVLALYRPQTDRNLSAMIDGNPEVAVMKYKEIYQAKQAINKFLEKIS